MKYKYAKPCPFCGMPTEIDGDYVIHQPNKSGSEHGRIFMRAEAWNIRPIEDALRRQIAELSWIPVGRQLPKDGAIVLAFCRDGDIQKVKYYEDKGWYTKYTRMRSLPYVTHWMPVHLPKEDE